MKNKKVLFGIAAVIILLIVVLVMTNRRSSYFIVENNEDGSVAVTAQKAPENAAGIGYITLEEGQELSVRSNLTDSSTVKIEVFPGEMDETTKALMEESFTAVDARTFELESGNYSIRITAEKGAEGSMDIKAE